MLLSVPSCAAWGPASWTDELVGAHDHLCSGLQWVGGVWGELGAVNTALSLEAFPSAYHRKSDSIFRGQVCSEARRHHACGRDYYSLPKSIFLFCQAEP